MNTRLRIARQLTLITVVAAACAILAYGVGWAVRGDTLPWEDTQRAAGTPTDGAHAGRGPAAQPTDQSTAEPTDEPTDEPTKDPSPTTPTTPAGPPPAGPALYSPGDDGAEVRDLQARLKQIDWFTGDVTDHYGQATETAVRGFQAKRGFEVTGEVDRRTLDRLHQMTRQPTKAELTNAPPRGDHSNQLGALDQRCTTGRVLCIDKSSRTLRWVVDGQVRKTVDVRFGSDETPTRDGRFMVESKSRDHVSSLFHTPMPYAMFFSGGQAVHYSSDFAARGYNGASHGCVNVRDRDAVAWLYDQVHVGDTVIVYWS